MSLHAVSVSGSDGTVWASLLLSRQLNVVDTGVVKLSSDRVR